MPHGCSSMISLTVICINPASDSVLRPFIAPINLI